MPGQPIQPISEWKKESHDISVIATVNNTSKGVNILNLPKDAWIEAVRVVPSTNHPSATSVVAIAQADGDAAISGTIARTVASKTGALSAAEAEDLTVDEDNNKVGAAEKLAVRINGTVVTDSNFVVYVRYTTVVK